LVTSQSQISNFKSRILLDYIELTIDLTPREPFTDIFMGALGELGFESFEETEKGLKAYIQADQYTEGMEETCWAWHLDGVDISAERTFIPRVNWNEEWEKNFEPILVDNHVYIHAPFHPAKPEVPYQLLIEPKMSFGTGHHQTTHMMVQFVMELDVANKSVLDMGCGTGILAILAAMRGATPVVGIDIDDWSVENTIENAERNNTEMRTQKGGAEVLGAEVFDVILANINKHVLLADMATYASVLKPGGAIVFSGFYTHDLADIEACANAFGLKLVSSKERETWQSAQFVKTGG
jgi:ribosomal protein L11 methyltransferase